MKILITGASGFVGGHVARALAGAHTLYGLARSASSAAAVEALGAIPVPGSLGSVDPASLAGIDAIIHCAAHVVEWGPRAEYFRVNVEGTRQLLEAAQAAGVTRFIHISTEAACFVGEALPQVDEDSAPLRPAGPYPYGASKAAAEALVLAASRPGFQTLALRPRLIWGPEDRTVLPGILDILARGDFWWVEGGRPLTSTCHVDNLVAAIRCALVASAEASGKAYYIADEGEVTYREFLSALVGTAGKTLPDRSLPGWLVRPTAGLLDRVWTLLGRTSPPPLTPMVVGMMSREITVRTERARRLLGWQPVIRREEGLRQLTA